MITQLYRYWDDRGTLLYIGISFNAFVRAAQHKNTKQWFSSASKMTIENFPTREAALKAEAKAIEIEKPVHNKLGQSLGPDYSDLMVWDKAARRKPPGWVAEQQIKSDYAQIANFQWDEKARIISLYIELMRSKPGQKLAARAALRAEKKLAEVEAYFARNPHRL